jgi:hypothetical protein
VDNVFDELDPSMQQYTEPDRAQPLPPNTFGAFQHEYNAGMVATGMNSMSASPEPSSIASFGSSYPPATTMTSPAQIFSPYSSHSSTPQASISPVVPLVQFQPGEASIQPMAAQNAKPVKRSQNHAEIPAFGASTKRRRSYDIVKRAEMLAEDVTTPELSDEEKLLFKLKRDGNMPWKDISKKFEETFGRPYQVPALQMRYKRLKERLRPWKEEDVRRRFRTACLMPENRGLTCIAGLSTRGGSRLLAE